jgi:iron complex outermembrane receptor protein
LLQAANNDKIVGHDNHFTVGVSVDHSTIDFSARSTLGFIFPDLAVAENAAIPGSGSVIHTLGDIGYGPVRLAAQNTYYGLYVTDTFDLTTRLSATAGARLNVAQIKVADLIGTSPELNSSPNFARLNPVAGLTYRLIPGLTVYGGYSESNRVPTPLELGCSSPTKPCLLENFLVADPPLKQVVGRTYEAGVRGDVVALAGGKLEWRFGVFRTDSSNDIINLASVIAGRGFFQNVGGTRRQGIEAGAQYQSKDWQVYATYSLIDGTYRFEGDIASPNNPSADENGNIHVVRGNRIPGIPRHQFKAGADYMATEQWRIGGDLAAVGSQFFIGDDANQNTKLPGYVVVNLHTSYQVTKEVQVFGLVNNLFNRKYALFGTYFDPQAVANAGLPFALSDPRTEVPGAPLSIYVGVRARLP